MYLLGIIKFSEDGDIGRLEEFHIIDVQDEVLDMVVDWHGRWLHNPTCLRISSVLAKEYDESNQSRNDQGFRRNKDKGRSVLDSWDIVPLKSSTGKTNIYIYTGSILDLKENIDIVVVSDSPNLGGEGGLAKALLVAGGPEYKRHRDKIRGFRGTKHHEGTILVCSAGKELPFERVVHAIIGRPNINYINVHLKLLASLISEIIKEINAISRGKTISLAFPMIGTGLY